jgi:hypothetical protein
MHSNISTRSLLLALAVLITAVFAYFLFSAFGGGGSAWKGWGENAPALTVEEKAEVLRSLTQTGSTRSPQASVQSAGVTPSEAAERLRTLENVAQSSSDSPAAQQSDADKLKVLRSINSQ